MHDLNTINRINAEAFAASIAKYRAQGRFVLARYEGSHLVAVETFSDQGLAQAALDSAVTAQHGGERNVLFTPTPAFHAAQRNQSEDLPALVAVPTEKTLGDYINRLESKA